MNRETVCAKLIKYSVKRFMLFFMITNFSSQITFGQNKYDTIYSNLEKRKNYSVSLYSMTGGYNHIYKVNEEVVEKHIYDYYMSYRKEVNECRPCILQTYDVNGHLIREGVQYLDAGVGWFVDYYPNGKVKLEGEYKQNPTKNWKDFWQRGYGNVPVGAWIYFDENGDTLYREFWEDGQFIRQIPEQERLEIWDVDLLLNEEKIINQSVTAEQINDLTIMPKYKNSNTNSYLSIRIELSCVGYKTIEKEFPIDSLKFIDFSSIFQEYGSSFPDGIWFHIGIFNDGFREKTFHLNIKK